MVWHKYDRFGMIVNYFAIILFVLKVNIFKKKNISVFFFTVPITM